MPFLTLQFELCPPTPKAAQAADAAENSPNVRAPGVGDSAIEATSASAVALAADRTSGNASDAAGAAERAEAACFALGALSVTFVDSREDPVLEPAPGEVRLWPATRVEALFPADTDQSAIISTLAATLDLRAERFTFSLLEDRAWEREWLRDFHSMRFGHRLWVAPRHEAINDPNAVVVRLDPGLAFGTGTHATTAMCLEWLDAQLSPCERVIDFGCGSGILALAAVKLGASEASCFDIDPQALLATRENAEENGLADRISICEQADQLPRGVDVLLANILSGPLIALAPSFASLIRPGGRVVLSGLMQHDALEVTLAYDACFDIRPFSERDGWICLAGVRRD